MADPPEVLPLRDLPRAIGPVVGIQPPASAPEESGLLYGGDPATPRRDSLRRRLLAVGDVAALLIAYVLLWIVASPSSAASEDLVLLVALPLCVVLNKALRLYDRDAHLIHKSTLNELPAILQSVSLCVALLFMAGPLLGGVAEQREPMIVLWALASVLTPACRWGARTYVRRTIAAERILIVGSGHVASLVSRKIDGHTEYGAAIVGYVDVPVREGSEIDADITRLGDIHDFEEVCRTHNVERVVIAFSSLAHEPLLDMIRISKRLRLKISVVPRLFEVIGHSVEIDQIEGMTLLGLRGLNRTHSTLLLKRATDVVGASVALVLAAPVLALAAAAIKLTSPGKVLFRQDRVGRGNRPFPMLKLRTMVDGAHAMRGDLAHLNEMDGRMFKIKDDPRITPVGRLLRRTSIDELPQLINVLRGEMSLVGPRPLVPDENDHIIGWHRARLDLTPGLTGPWQVMGRNAIPFDEMVKLDYLYVAEWSLWNDLKLLVRTLPVVLGRRGS